MRTKVIEIITALGLGFLIPALLVSLIPNTQNLNSNKEDMDLTNHLETASKSTISVIQVNNTVDEMPIEQYVLSVVLAEMPADFEIEALKAQAIVARTYALHRTERGGKHAEAAVCTLSSCCQGLCTPEDYLNNKGNTDDVDKVRNAVEATSGIVLVYDGSLIDATYFSCSGGFTEDAQAVWGTAVPYLQAVESPGEEGATHYVDTIKFSSAEFASILGLPDSKANPIKIGKITFTDGGGVDTIEISGKVFTGTQLRKLLNLRSTSFYISPVSETVTITTKGFGHRVGMSQYGADAMALKGATYIEILTHYYQGVDLIHFDID